MSGPGVVEQYWTGVSTQLQVEADVFNRLVGHNGEMGRANELALAQLVGRLLPLSVGVGTGVIIDSASGRSQQTDLIVYERASQPQILAQSTQLLFPVETVLAAIEVKTTVDAAAIGDCASKAAAIRALRTTGNSKPPLIALFGFNAASSPISRAIELNDLVAAERPDIACILNPGLVGRPGPTQGVSLVPLHETDGAGARKSRTWRAAPTNQSSVAIGSTNYPVSRLRPRGDRVVFEPGRALLLFAEYILAGLSERTQIDASWLAGYLPDIAHEVEPAIRETGAQ